MEFSEDLPQILLPYQRYCKDTPENIIYNGHIAPKLWANPLNWEIRNNGIIDEELTMAAPFINRIPCKDDDIIFPESNSFKISLTKSWSVKSITKDSEKLSDSELQLLLLSDQENFFISEDVKLTLTEAVCPKKGCTCGYDEYKEVICGSFQCPSVSEKCTSVVQPINDCCQRCGALLHLDMHRKFNFDHCWNVFNAFLNEKMEKELYKKMKFYMKKFSESKVEIILTEILLSNNSGEASLKAMKLLEKKLGILDSQSPCWLSNATVIHGLPTILKPHSIIGDESRKRKIAVAVVIPLILLIAIVIICVAYRKRKQQRNVPVVKFTNESFNEHAVRIEGITESDLSAPSMGATGGYTNPVFEAMDDELRVTNEKPCDIQKVDKNSPSPLVTSPPPSYREKEKVDNIEAIGHAHLTDDVLNAEKVDLPVEDIDVHKKAMDDAVSKAMTLLALSSKAKKYIDQSDDSHC